jgi:hypothetical protein
MAKRTLESMMGDDDGAQPENRTKFRVGGEPLTDELPNESQAGPEASAPRSQYDGAKKFAADEILMPRLALAQAMSPEVKEKRAEAGEFLLMGSDPVESVTLVIAGHTEQRRFVEPNASKARCWSPDGIQGYGNPGIECDGCPFSEWTESGRLDGDGKMIRLRPACDPIDSYAAFSITHGMPVLWNLKGTALKASRMVKTLANAKGMGLFALDISSMLVTGKNRNSWYEPLVRLSPGMTPEDCKMYADIARAAVGAAVTVPEAPIQAVALS